MRIAWLMLLAACSGARTEVASRPPPEDARTVRDAAMSMQRSRSRVRSMLHLQLRSWRRWRAQRRRSSLENAAQARAAAAARGASLTVPPGARNMLFEVPKAPGDYELRLHANDPTRSTHLVHRVKIRVGD